MILSRKLIVVSALAALSLPATAFGAPNANVVLAKPSPDVVYIWKTNDDVTELVGKHFDAAAIQRELLARASSLLISSLPQIPAAAKTITVRLIYFRSGGTDSNYRVETVAGVDALGLITATRKDAAASAARSWPEDFRAGKTPANVKAQFTADALQSIAR